MPVTLQQIADDLQVSTATVSRSLRDDPLIPSQTRDKVRATADRMGYQSRARALYRKRQGEIAQGEVAKSETTSTRNDASSREMLGLLVPATSLDQMVRERHDLNFVQIMQGVMTQAETVGKLVTVHFIRPHREAHLEKNPSEVPSVIRERSCQALIVRGAFHPDDIAFLARYQPVVTVGRSFQGLPVDAVVPDSVAGVELLVTHLAELGHRRLAWVGGDIEASFIRERQAGFVTGCLSQGLELRQQRFFGKELLVKGRITEREPLLQAAREGTTAMVCANDALAGQVVAALEQAGLRVPQDVSVTGFDAGQPTDAGRQVTTINPCFAELGRAAVRMAMQRASHSDARPCILTVRGELVPGDTSAPAPK